jgi:hypothetical protein
MNIRLLGVLLGSVICLIGPTFAQDTVDPRTMQQIRVLAAKYDEAYNKHDSAAVAALYTEDGVYSTRHGTYVRGLVPSPSRHVTSFSIGVPKILPRRSIG